MNGTRARRHRGLAWCELSILAAVAAGLSASCTVAPPTWQELVMAGLADQCDIGGDQLHIDAAPNLLLDDSHPAYQASERHRTEGGCDSSKAEPQVADLLPLGLLPQFPGDGDRHVAVGLSGESEPIGWVRILEQNLDRPAWRAVPWPDVPEVSFEAPVDDLPDLILGPPTDHLHLGDACTFGSRPRQSYDITISNNGPGAVARPFSIQANVLDGGVESYVIRLRRPMLPGEAIKIERVSHGSVFVVDVDGEIVESDEGNNRLTTPSGQQFECR